MSEPYTIYRRRYDEIVVPGKPLGRHIMRDSRSAAYPFVARTPVPVESVTWSRSIAILDQGDLGSCTGNAITGALGTAPLYPNLPANHPTLNEAEAVKLYGLATQLDGYPGTYPPSDTGSDGTSACKAAQKSGFISGYTHATTIDQVLQALMVGPFIMGCDWYDSFDEPDASGLVSIASGAGVRGGHEILGRGVHVDSNLIMFDNSWGTGYGVAGSFYMSYDTVAQLLASDGDATVPLPLSVPAPIPTPVPVPPTPTPVPVVDPVDVTLANSTRAWSAARHVGSNRKAAQDVIAWRKAKGL